MVRKQLTELVVNNKPGSQNVESDSRIRYLTSADFSASLHPVYDHDIIDIVCDKELMEKSLSLSSVDMGYIASLQKHAANLGKATLGMVVTLSLWFYNRTRNTI